MDHRVSPDREAGDLHICSYFLEATEAESWWIARNLYFQEEICRRNDPSGSRLSAYLRPTNRENLVPEKVAGFDDLVHVGSLNALLRRSSRSEREADVDVALRRLAGRGLPSKPVAESDPDWFLREVAGLAYALLSRGENVIRATAGLLANACGDTEPPWWACFTEEILSALDPGDATKLCTALGLGHRTGGEWLLVWRYPVSDAGALYRPTAIEANDSPYHFPSPPKYPFGITMPLASGFASCREVLHRPLRGSAAADRCTGKLLYLENTPIIGDNARVAALRAGHRERLKREFAATGAAWLDRHTDPLP
ncbi:MAG TPA: hypothetical protein VF173_17655 [Thermoanaerobaculia bacterium]|nr:hypothetical protein [Thermoanaerobaculia bacterium]